MPVLPVGDPSTDKRISGGGEGGARDGDAEKEKEVMQKVTTGIQKGRVKEQDSRAASRQAHALVKRHWEGASRKRRRALSRPLSRGDARGAP